MDVMVLETQKWLNDTYAGQTGFVPFTQEELDGVTGAGTFRRLVQALQIELNVSVDGSFGNDTLNAMPASISTSSQESNMSYIIQGSLWCKGYSAGTLDGIFGESTKNAVISFQEDAGITADGIIKPYILQGIMNTDGYKYSGSTGTNDYYKHLVQLGMNTNYGSQIGLTAPNGLWERTSHRNYIKCCQIEWGASPVDGIWGTGTMNKAPTLSRNTSGYTNSKRLLQWGLTINGFYPGNLAGSFDSTMYTAVYNFQDFLCLGADGIAGKTTWASLLSSRGNTARSATAFDTSTRLTSTTANDLKNAGYIEVGRYLTNIEGSSLDKKMTNEELQIIKDVGLKVFPIFQTYGGEASYFNRYQGQRDAESARAAAQSFGFPPKSTIYFAVDYDALMDDINTNIVPHFRGINEEIGNSYKVGVYGPRAVCNRLAVYGLATRSFVSDMSTGFTGNIGQIMPSNWAYDQFYETTVGGIGIDKCVASPRSTAISPSEFITYENPDEPAITQSFLKFKQIYDLAWQYLESISVPSVGVYASVFNANLMAIQYLRSSEYDGSGASGVAWDTIAGNRDPGFVQLAESTYSDIVPEDLVIVDPVTGKNIEFAHYAATLNACITSTLGFDFDFIERDVDAFAGWAGDLMQMAGILQLTLDYGNYNYFTTQDMAFMIGAVPGTLDNYHLYEYRDDAYQEQVNKSAGFSQEDLYQDVDAYNISRIYDLSTTKFYVALDDYYNVSRNCEHRFSIFKRELLEQFEKDTLYDVALEFAKEDVFMLSPAFEIIFGDFSSDIYGEVLAQAFDEKISSLAASM